MRMRLETTARASVETSERPRASLKVTATVGSARSGCAAHRRVPRPLPRRAVNLILTNEELDLAMREAGRRDPAARPAQPDLIQRRSVHGAFPRLSPRRTTSSVRRAEIAGDLDAHRILSLGGDQPSYLLAVHWLSTAGREAGEPRPYHVVVNNIAALKIAVETGAGIGVLPDYAVDGDNRLTQILRDVEMPSLDSYLVYAEEMRSVARVQAFRDFLGAKAQRWKF
jgi:DNA-binding transcriptional LysR family regulator